MLKIMNELRKLRLIRKQEEANAAKEENPGGPGVDLKKQSQFSKGQMSAYSIVGERYENKPRPGFRENKAKQSQCASAPETCVFVHTKLIAQKRPKIFLEKSDQ